MVLLNKYMYLSLFQAEENVKHYLDTIGEKFSVFTKTKNLTKNEQNYRKKNKNSTEKMAITVDIDLVQPTTNTDMNNIL